MHGKVCKDCFGAAGNDCAKCNGDRSRGLRYNGSGYYDETAYRAINNIEREEKKIMAENNGAVVGEIWEMETQTGYSREVLMIQCFDDYATILTLVENQPQHTYMQLRGRGMMYVDCARLGYCFYDRLTGFVRKLSDDEMNEVLSRIGYALDIPMVEAETAGTTAEPVAEVEQDAETEKHATRLASSMIALAEMTREKDVYKMLYEKLMDKILNK